MSENNASDNGKSPQVGALLRASRMRLGDDLRDVADVLCIRYLYLEAIEDCRYDDLPGETYAIGFIRSYAEHMGLDGEEVVRRFRAEQSGTQRANDLSFPTPVPESGIPKGAVVFVGVVLAVLIYGGWYITTTDEDFFETLISPVPDHLQELVDDNAATIDQPPATSGAELPTERSEAEGSPSGNSNEAAGQEVTSATTPRNTEPTLPQPDPEPVAAVDEAVSAATEQAEQVAENAAETVQDTREAAEQVVEGAAASTEEAVSTAVETTETVAETAATEAGEVAEAATETATSAVEEASVAVTETVQETTSSVSEAASENTATGVSSPAADTGAESQPPTEPVADATEPLTNEVGDPVAELAEPVPQAAEQFTADDLNAQALRAATGQSEPSPQETATAPETGSEQPTEATEQAAVQPDAVASDGIFIRAADDSWVEITDTATGQVVFTGVMTAGQGYGVPDRSGLVLATGNAGVLDVFVDGSEVPKLGGVGAVRRGVAMDEARLRAGTATQR